MNPLRIIPRLDIKGPNLVKGIQMEGLRVLGDPYFYATKYYQENADELIYIDTVASLYGRNNLTEFVSHTANDIYIPLCVGGGIRKLDDIYKLLRAGADKVAINTEALKNPTLIQEASREFGSQCIVISIQAKKMGNEYISFMENGREPSNKKVLDWCREAADLGAGELLITSVDNEGTGKGMDIALLQSITEKITIPVIASGGIGSLTHVIDAVTQANIDGIAIASMLHYNALEDFVQKNAMQDYTEGDLSFLKKSYENNKFGRKNIDSVSLSILKEFCTKMNIECRQ